MSRRTRKNTYKPGKLMRILDVVWDWLPWVLFAVVVGVGYILVKGNPGVQ